MLRPYRARCAVLESPTRCFDRGGVGRTERGFDNSRLFGIGDMSIVGAGSRHAGLYAGTNCQHALKAVSFSCKDVSTAHTCPIETEAAGSLHWLVTWLRPALVAVTPCRIPFATRRPHGARPRSDTPSARHPVGHSVTCLPDLGFQSLSSRPRRSRFRARQHSPGIEPEFSEAPRCRSSLAGISRAAAPSPSTTEVRRIEMRRKLGRPRSCIPSIDHPPGWRWPG